MSSKKARIEGLRGRLKSTKTTATVEEDDDSLMGKSNYMSSLIREKIESRFRTGLTHI